MFFFLSCQDAVLENDGRGQMQNHTGATPRLTVAIHCPLCPADGGAYLSLTEGHVG